MVDVSETKERLGTCVRPKRACLRWYTGEDSGRWKLFFHEAVVADRTTLLRVWLLEAGYLLAGLSYRGRLCWLPLLTDPVADRRMSSENMGAASGDESRTPGWKKRSETLEASDIVSLLEPGRLRLSSTSMTGSMASRLRLSHPFLILILASASLFCSVLVIYKEQC